MTIVFVTATGEIVQTSAEDIDTSAFDPETHTVFTGHSGVDAAGQIISPRTHVYEGGAFVAIPEPTAAEVFAAYQLEGYARVSSHFDMLSAQDLETAMFPARFTNAEKLTWDIQDKEADEVIAGATDSPLNNATLNGESALTLANQIKANRNTITTKVMLLIKARRTFSARIDAATTTAEIDAILASLPESLG